MSVENNDSAMGGTFNIFGDGALDLGSASLPDPFAAGNQTESETAEEQPEITQAASAPAEETAAQPPAAPVESAPQPKSEPKPVSGGSQKETEPENLLSAAASKAEAKQTAVTADALFSKAPVFVYAAASEEIGDATITFEQLRIEKAPDFPELDDGKRVSWAMEYCGITRNVTTPAKTVIGTLKKEIENSKEFLEALKKAKDKNPTCNVKPKITAQSKGIAGYKGVFPTMEEADASDKHIRIVPARDGHVYEIRCTEAGKFIARAENVKELSEISAGFVPALPRVPFPLFAQVLAFFRHYMQKDRAGLPDNETEVMVYIYWDKECGEYLVRVPMQTVSKAHISVVIPPDETIDADRYVHVADIHSHNSMPAFFSGTDDRDELATRVYMVVGNLNAPLPQIRTRICVGGRFVPIDARQFVDIPFVSSETDPKTGDTDLRAPQCVMIPTDLENQGFPTEWLAAVSVAENVTSCFYPVELPKNQGFLLQCLMKLNRRNRYFGFLGERTMKNHEI